MNRHIFPAALIGLLLLAPNGTSAQAGAQRYTIENLGTIDGFAPTITGMNDKGEMSGYFAGADGTYHAVRYSGGVWSRVPGLDSVPSLAMAINAWGDVTGYESGGAVAFRYSDSVGLTVIPSLPGATSALASAINANGDVVGTSSIGTDGTETYGWISRHGSDTTRLPTLGGSFGQACGINDNGQVAGSSTNSDNSQHAFRLEPDESITDLGTLDGVTGLSVACAIDADGRIGGISSGGGNGYHAVLFDGDVISNLDSFSSPYSAVTATSGGVSVGFYYTSDFTQQRAMVHTTANGSRDLNDLTTMDAGWLLNQAIAVNSKGEIAVAGGTLDGLNSGAFKLTPVSTGDVTAPTIDSLTATPSIVTLPNKAMVPVVFTASATDDRDPNPVCAVTALDGHGAGDGAITGDLSATVRATGGATYSFTVTCHDAAGNAATRGVDVFVLPDTTAPSIAGVTVNPSTVTPPNGRLVSVTVSVTANDNSEEAPVCGISSITSNGAGANDDSSVTGQFTAALRAVGGRTYALGVECHDAVGNSAVRSVNVVVPPDTTAPWIAGVTANPSTIAPPDGKMVPVTVSVNATDDSGQAPVCGISSITNAGMGPDDVSVTGPFTALIRAIGGRTYSVRVACHDAAGNSSTMCVYVVVPPDTTAPTITSLSATPSRLWPPNGKMMSVAVSVAATDDVDSAPRCTLTSVTGGWGDSVITGPLSANVRANKDTSYTLQVTCSDRAGNSTRENVNVAVLKDDPALTAATAVRSVAARVEQAGRNEKNEKNEKNEDNGRGRS